MKPYRSIRGRDIDGHHASPLDVRLYAANLRRRRAAKGLCINSDAHGLATHGCRCVRCAAIHKHGAVRVNELGLEAFVQGNE